MTSPPRRAEIDRRGSRLAVRLAAVLVAVAVVSVVVFATIIFLVDRNDVRNAARQQRQAAVTAMTAAARASYQQAGSWAGVDLSGVEVLAADNHFGVRVTTATGRVVAERTAPSPTSGTAHTVVRVGGSTVGTLTITFPAQELTAADNRLRHALETSVLTAAPLAVAVALGCALVLSRRLTRPVRDLTAAVRRRAAGQPAGLELLRPGPAEIGELSRAFRTMVTDLDRHEQLRRSMVADIAHELRTPIAVLQGETEALSDGLADLTPAAAESLHEEVLRLARLVEDLQTLAAAQAAGLEMRPVRLDLAEIAASAGAGQQRALIDGGLSWEADLSPAVVDGDPLRLHQIVTNLLTNAIKYTPAGGQVRLTVRADGPSAVLEVQDTGPGIPVADLPHIYERFRRGGHDAVPGSGIGLAVTAALVAAHHGRIEITNPPLGGTRAAVRFPAAR